MCGKTGTLVKVCLGVVGKNSCLFIRLEVMTYGGLIVDSIVGNVSVCVVKQGPW
jgi:hypothetical protein